MVFIVIILISILFYELVRFLELFYEDVIIIIIVI